jgi:hypothetical protein
MISVHTRQYQPSGSLNSKFIVSQIEKDPFYPKIILKLKDKERAGM